MKCPSCQFVCSELRDICPKCLIDMRPYKKNTGLPVTNPRASYAELAAKLSRAPKAAEPKTSEKKEVTAEGSGFFARLRKLTEPSIPTAQKSEVLPPAPAKEDVPQRVLKDRRHALPRVDLDELLESTEEQLRQTQSDKKTEAINEQLEETKAPPYNAASENTITPSPIEPLIGAVVNPQPVLSNMEPPAPMNEPTLETQEPPAHEPKPEVLDFTLEGADMSALLDKLIAESDVTIEVVKEAEREDKAGANRQSVDKALATPDVNAETHILPIEEEASSTETVQVKRQWPEMHVASDYFESLPIRECEDETAAFFSTAFQDAHAAEEMIELHASEFVPPCSNEEMDIYFDLALEAIDDPESEKRFVAAQRERVDCQVLSVELSHELAEFERRVNQPAALRKQARKAVPEEELALPPPPPQAGLWPRLLTMLVDSFGVSILSAMAALAMLWQRRPDLPLIVAGDDRLDIYDVVYFTGIFTSAFFVLMILYPLYNLLTKGSSRGMQTTNLLVLEERGLPAAKTNLIVRALTLPLSLLFFGWLPILFGRRPLHDRLARTMVTTME